MAVVECSQKPALLQQALFSSKYLNAACNSNGCLCSIPVAAYPTGKIHKVTELGRLPRKYNCKIFIKGEETLRAMCLWEWITFSSNYPEIWKLCARELLQELAWDYVFTHFKEGQIYKATVIYSWIGATRDWAASHLFGGLDLPRSDLAACPLCWAQPERVSSYLSRAALSGLQIFTHSWYKLRPSWTRGVFGAHKMHILEVSILLCHTTQ